MIKNDSVQKFLDELASQNSTPGGGSAAAIMGAMGAALVSMVCNLTIGKKNYAAVEMEMKSLLGQTEELRHKITAQIQGDVAAFDQVMAAYGLPKNSDEEKTKRTAAIQAALKEATQVPLECAKLSREVMRLSESAAQSGNLNVVSDAGVAVLAAHAALKAAALNVYVNAGAIKDEAFRNNKLAVLESFLAGADAHAGKVYTLVKNKLM
ncbi:MAG: methenyltetrahydrofolate cyclohydrolase [Burkholderiales bacterium]